MNEVDLCLLLPLCVLYEIQNQIFQQKVSFLYKLPYWKNKKFKHNIDVMHVEKKISKSTYGTLLGIEGKNKDTDKAQIDL